MTIYYIPKQDGTRPEGTPLWAVPIDRMGITPKPSAPLKNYTPPAPDYANNKMLRDFAGIDPMPDKLPASTSAGPPPRRKGGLDTLFM